MKYVRLLCDLPKPAEFCTDYKIFVVGDNIMLYETPLTGDFVRDM